MDPTAEQVKTQLGAHVTTAQSMHQMTHSLFIKDTSSKHRQQHPNLERLGQLDRRVCSSVSCFSWICCRAAASREGHLAR